MKRGKQETDEAGGTPKFRAARNKKGEVQKFSSFRTPGIPRIVCNGEIKNSFLIRKGEFRENPKGGQGKETTYLYRTVEHFFMFSLVYDCHIGLPSSAYSFKRTQAFILYMITVVFFLRNKASVPNSLAYQTYLCLQ
jgi:hypothetical protein